jgi:type I restriction enzyme S subunit
MSFLKYPEYRPSKVQWLADIPAHWSIFSLKRSVDGCVNGIWGNEPTGADDTAVIRVADFERNNLRVGLSKLTYRDISPKEHENRALSSGDLLIEKSGGGEKTLVGCVVLFAHEFTAVTSNFVARMRPLNGFDGCFLCYCFDSLYQGRANYPSIKQTTGIQNLDSEAYLQERFCFPPILEQTQIAAFLDHETAKIDTLIHEQKRLIELLKEKRQAVISHVVTKGLDPSVPMKDSGVEWLGKVPAHWTVSKVKHVAIIKGGYAFSSNEFSESGVQLIRIGNLYQSRLQLDREPIYIPMASREKYKPFEIRPGDLLMSLTGTLGKRDYGFAVMYDFDEPSLLNQRVAKITPLPKKMEPAFLLLLLQSEDYLNQIYSFPSGTKQANLSNSDVLSPWIVSPSCLQEQSEIVNRVSELTSRLDQLISKAGVAISLLQERRSAIISAAVTGKIDVRDWQPPADEGAFDEEVRQAGMEAVV